MANPYYKTAVGPKSYLDTRDDLGYGRLNPKFHTARTHGDNSFPYVDEPEDIADVDVDDETLDAINWKTIAPQGGDPGAKYATTPFYFAGGNTKLGEGTSPGISPFPGMYKNKRRTATGSGYRGRTARADASTTASLVNRGDHRGWSTMAGFQDDEEPAYSLSDIAEKELRECIRYYIKGML